MGNVTGKIAMGFVLVSHSEKKIVVQGLVTQGHFFIAWLTRN